MKGQEVAVSGEGSREPGRRGAHGDTAQRCSSGSGARAKQRGWGEGSDKKAAMRQHHRR